MAQKRVKSYPEDAVFEDWFVSKDSGRLAVKRFIKRKGKLLGVERLPIAEYREDRDNEKELRDFVTRKNGRDPKEGRAKELVRYRNAFLAPDLMKDYRDHYLPAHIPTKKDAGTMFKYLREYALDWMVLKRGLNFLKKSDTNLPSWKRGYNSSNTHQRRVNDVREEAFEKRLRPRV